MTLKTDHGKISAAVQIVTTPLVCTPLITWPWKSVTAKYLPQYTPPFIWAPLLLWHNNSTLEAIYYLKSTTAKQKSATFQIVTQELLWSFNAQRFRTVYLHLVVKIEFVTHQTGTPSPVAGRHDIKNMSQFSLVVVECRVYLLQWNYYRRDVRNKQRLC
jgi:hypothetical protein